MRHFSLARSQLRRFRGREVKTLGDGILATFDGPARAVQCAQAIAAGVRPLGIAIRAGLHTGEVEIRDDNDISGIAVNIASRVSHLAGNSEVLASSTVKDLVAGSGLIFHDLGFRAIKGLEDELRIFVATITNKCPSWVNLRPRPADRARSAFPREADFGRPQAQDRSVPILLKKSLCAAERKFLEPLMRFMRGHVIDLSVDLNRSRTSVVALKSDAAAEKP